PLVRSPPSAPVRLCPPVALRPPAAATLSPYPTLSRSRRLGRVRLDPPVELLGPDAATITAAQFRAALPRGVAPVKARLLGQQVIAGIGNLLADEILWLARINPGQPQDLVGQQVEIGRA